MERWTRFVLRRRWPFLVAWIVVLFAGLAASARLSALLSNDFLVPGTDSERARTILQEEFGDRPDGSYLVVFRVRSSSALAERAGLEARLRRAAKAVPTASAQRLQAAGPHVLYGSVNSQLKLSTAKNYTDEVRRAIGRPPDTTAYVTGAAAIQHDLDPIFNKDLAKGESIALPIAFLVLLAVFGFSLALTIPFIFAACTIFTTLGIVFVIAHELEMATYVTNLVQLIGLGIAVDYSLLVVYRYREELERGDGKDEAVVRTMKTAGRAVVFSGATVAIGLALLLFMPIPFIRGMGVGGFLIPLVSIVAAMTLQPVLLSFYGRKGMTRLHLLPRRFRSETQAGFWHRLAGSIMRRPVVYLVVGASLLIAAALPALALHLTPGEAAGTPQNIDSIRGFNLMRNALGPGAVAPSQVVVDAGKGRRVVQPRTQAAIRRLAFSSRRDPEVVRVTYAPVRPFVDSSGRYAQVVIAGMHDYGEVPAQRFAHRLRDELIPAARFPAGTRVLAGGAPPQGIDFLHQSYKAFPWLVLAVLVLTYLLLLRAFRSLLLPLKAVILNLLSVGASYGLLVIVFRWGVGRDVLGLYQYPQIEGWIPIFLFAMLFGLSMDYEVFLVSRMREEWDRVHDNTRAVAEGLEKTGRIVTAAAIIMVAAFSGFVAGSILGLQEFGLGLAVAILFDATIIRAVLVPSLMALFGRYNWWLPPAVARTFRVPPSGLEPAATPAFRAAAR